MSTPESARLAAVSPPFLRKATASELADWQSVLDPDVVLLTGDPAAGEARRRAADTLRHHAGPETPCIDPADGSGPRLIDSVQFLVAPSVDALASLGAIEAAELDPTQPTFVVSPLLDLDVDTTALSATLRGRKAYVDALDPDSLDGEYVHISTRLPAGYRREWDGLAVVGGGADAGSAGSPLVALDCRTDGRTLTHERQPTRLGLRALDGVGATRAGTLREAGFRDREAVADAPPSRLADLDGFGRKTAERIVESASAVAGGAVVRTTDATLPHGDPVYIDIETDGLSPTITWLIGVLDGTAAEGRYMPFLQTDPDEPGRALADFMAWYSANASGRPLVAYNGWGFDFEVLYDHIVEYCPRYLDDWTSTYRFDPLQWAVDEGNAVLPGRTNTLEDVAEALGYERAGTGLTGAAVARTYRQWMAEQSPPTEPDWDRFESYCEDDVRALATVYEAIEEQRRLTGTDDQPRDVDETTTQGTLSEW